MTALPWMPVSVCSGERVSEQRVVSLRVQLVLDRHRVGDHDRVGKTEPVGGPHDRGDLLRFGNRPVEVVAGVGDVEARESQRPVADDGDSERLEAFQGRRARRGSTSPRRRRP